MQDVATIDRAEFPATVLEAEAASAHRYTLAEKADASRRAYRSDFRHFAGWCAARNLSPMPATADTVCAYLAALADAGMKASTIRRRTAAIGYAHRLAAEESQIGSEAVRAVLRGIRRELGTAPDRKAALTADRIHAMIDAIPGDDLIGLRDRALLAIGFCAALRRSELVALDVSDIEERAEGVMLHIRRSKTDQEGAGHVIPVLAGTKLRPVALLRQYLAAARITDGAIFRSIRKGNHVQADRLSDRAVAEIVKARAAAAGLDPTLFSAHSLRAGLITSAAKAGASVFRIQQISRHKSVDVLAAYVRVANAFEDHCAASFA